MLFCLAASSVELHDLLGLVRQLLPRRVYQSKFRTISFLIQVPRKTNDRERICEHNLQLSLNCIHTFLYFLFLPMRCRSTLT